MDELAFLMDWDLEAINQTPTTNIPHFSHLFSEQDHELFQNFPEFSETTNILIDEFDFKLPFYPLSSQTMVTNSLSIPKEHEEVKEIKQSDEKEGSYQDLQVPTSKCKRSKKYKNKSNIVKKVTVEDGTLCDAWAWRKYGQKPIKGSPYPRSYYKCSTSKGCLARKQVEKNHLDPKFYLVTYTSEHNHPQPTRRNSLAGSTRKNNILLVSGRSKTQSQGTSNNLVKMEDDDEATSMKKQSNDDEDHHLLEWLDGAQLCGDGGWIPSKELEEFFWTR